MTMESGSKSSKMALRMLLVTSNVGSLFEQPDAIGPGWTAEILKAIKRHQANFVAIHMQEVGGKNYKKHMCRVKRFIGDLWSKIRVDISPTFKGRAFIDEEFHSKAKFTALGNLYFYDQALSAQLWNFADSTFQSQESADGCFVAVHDALDACPTIERMKFPQRFFPEQKFTRKGLLRSRWRFPKQDGRIIDFVNTHLFHDACNLLALDRSPSVYTDLRREALQYAVEWLHKDGVYPTFIFGDFNFRLDTKQVVEYLTASESDLEHVEEEDVGGRVISFVKKSNQQCVLRIETKRFEHEKHEKLFELHEVDVFLKLDNEVKQFPDLYECTISFPPSYPYSEDLNEPTFLMRTRAPAWCDRVLMNSAAWKLVKPLADANACSYELIGRDVCMGDHKPVYLAIDLPAVNGTLSEGERPSLVSSSRSCLQCPCALCALFTSHNGSRSSAKFTLLDLKQAILNLSPAVPQWLNGQLSPVKVYTMRIRSMKGPSNSKFVTMITLEDDCTVTIYDAKSCAIESYSKFDRFDECPELKRPLMVLPSPTISEDIEIIVNRAFDDALGDEMLSSQYSTPAPLYKVRPWTPERASPKILPCSLPVSDIIRKFEEQTPPLPPIPHPRKTIADRSKSGAKNKLEGSNILVIPDAAIRFFDSSNSSLPVKRFESTDIHAIRKPLPRPRYSRRNALTVEDNPPPRLSLLSRQVQASPKRSSPTRLSLMGQQASPKRSSPTRLSQFVRQSSQKQSSPKAAPSIKKSPAPMPKPVERMQSANIADGNLKQTPASPAAVPVGQTDNTKGNSAAVKRKESDLVSIPKGYSSIMKVEDSSGRLEAVFGKPIASKVESNANNDGNIVRKNSSKRRSFLHNIQSRLSTNGSRRKLARKASSRTKADRKPASSTTAHPQKPNQARPVISGPFIAVPNANGQFPPLLIPVIHTHPAHPIPQKRSSTKQSKTEVKLAAQGPNVSTLTHQPIIVSAAPNPIPINGAIPNIAAAPMPGVPLRNLSGSGSHQQSPNSASVVHEPVIVECWTSSKAGAEGEYIAMSSRYAPSSIYSVKAPIHTSVNPPLHYYPHPNRKSYPMKRESSYENCRIS